MGYWKYLTSLLLAFLLTAGMMAAISLGLSYVATTGDKDEILSLGFASLFRGRYVEKVEPEWLFSLTAPRERRIGAPEGQGTDALMVKGFGAPLWVLLHEAVSVAQGMLEKK